MARKHFPTLNEYASWVVRQPAGVVLGTAFDGVSYPYEAYLSEYYGTSVVVIAGDVYEMNNRRYDLPVEWDGFTVGYHDSDLCDAWEAAGGPQSGIEVTTEIEIAYLIELLGADAVKVPAGKQARKAEKELIKSASIARYTDKATGKFLGFSVKSNRGKGYYEIHCAKDAAGSVVYTCDCEAKEWGHPVCSHVQAVVELVEARKALQLDAAAVVAPLVLGTFSEDLDAHVADELSEQESEMGECEAQMWVILAAERDAQVRAEVEAIDDIDSDPFDLICQPKPIELHSCELCGRLTKADVCAWCLGVAA